MARERSPDRDKAFQIWKDSGGNILLKDIANQLGISDSQIRKWKNIDKWDYKLKGNVTNGKSNVTIESKHTKNRIRRSLKSFLNRLREMETSPRNKSFFAFISSIIITLLSHTLKRLEVVTRHPWSKAVSC